MTEHHRRLDDEIADAAVGVVVDVAAAHPDRVNRNLDVALAHRQRQIDLAQRQFAFAFQYQGLHFHSPA